MRANERSPRGACEPSIALQRRLQVSVPLGPLLRRRHLPNPSHCRQASDRVDIRRTTDGQCLALRCANRDTWYGAYALVMQALSFTRASRYAVVGTLVLSCGADPGEQSDAEPEPVAGCWMAGNGTDCFGLSQMRLFFSADGTGKATLFMLCGGGDATTMGERDVKWSKTNTGYDVRMSCTWGCTCYQSPELSCELREDQAEQSLHCEIGNVGYLGCSAWFSRYDLCTQ